MIECQLKTTPKADDWDGNIVISDTEEPIREKGGEYRMLPDQHSGRRRVFEYKLIIYSYL